MRWIRVLAASFALTTLAAAPSVAAADTAPVAAYGFEQTSGTTATDQSSYANHGAISGATSVSDGRFGRALSFDGTNDWVRVPDANSLDLTTGMTLEAWVYPQTRRRLAHRRCSRSAPATSPTGSTASAPVLAERAADRRRGNDYRMADGAVAADRSNTWSHLAATFDGATAAALHQRRRWTSTAAYNGLAHRHRRRPATIGGNAIWSEWFDGMIDEVRVYDRALDAPPRSRRTWTPRSSPARRRRPTPRPPTPDKIGQLDRPRELAAGRRPRVDAVQRQGRDVGRLRRRDGLRADLGPGDRHLPADAVRAEPLLRRPRPAAGRAAVHRGRARARLRGDHGHGAAEPADRLVDGRGRRWRAAAGIRRRRRCRTGAC